MPAPARLRRAAISRSEIGSIIPVVGRWARRRGACSFCAGRGAAAAAAAVMAAFAAIAVESARIWPMSCSMMMIRSSIFSHISFTSACCCRRWESCEITARWNGSSKGVSGGVVGADAVPPNIDARLIDIRALPVVAEALRSAWSELLDGAASELLPQLLPSWPLNMPNRPCDAMAPARGGLRSEGAFRAEAEERQRRQP